MGVVNYHYFMLIRPNYIDSDKVYSVTIVKEK